MNIYKAIQTKKSMDDDIWWDTFLSTLTSILSSAPKLKDSPHYHAEIETATGNIRTLIHRRLQSTEVKKRTNYLIQHETDITIESIQHIQQLALHSHPAYKSQLVILTNHADRLVDALMSYDIGGTTRKLDEINVTDIKRSDEMDHSSFIQLDAMGQKLKKTISLLKPIQHHNHHHSRDRRQMNVVHGGADQSNSIKNTKTSFLNLFSARKSSRSSLRDLFNTHKKRDDDNSMAIEALLPDKLYDSFYQNHSSHNKSNNNSNNNNTIQPNRREIKGRRSDSVLSSLISPPSIDSTPMIKRRNSLIITTEHYYDDPYFFNEFPSLSPTDQQPTATKVNTSKASTISSSDSSYFSAKSSSLHSFAEQVEAVETTENDPATPIPIPQSSIAIPPLVEYNAKEVHPGTTKRKNTIRQLTGPPPLHQPGQSKKSREKDGSPLYHVFDKNGRKIMVLEILAGKPKMVAATKEQLLLKLADESPQDFDYVDAYLLNHTSFTSSSELLDDLIARFYLEPSPGHYDYFNQWQKRIQIKTLNVLSRWIKLQFSDFIRNRSLLFRLEEFCGNDLVSAGFATESEMIKDSMYAQAFGQHAQYDHNHYDHSPCTASTPPLATSRNNFGISTSSPIVDTTPPDSPLLSAHYQLHHHSSHYHHQQHHYSPHHFYQQRNNNNNNNSNIIISPFLSFNAKDIAKYLTLADYHLIRQIKPQDYLDNHWRDIQYNDISLSEIGSKGDFIGILTKRANMVNHWIIHELATAKTSKQRKAILRKLIETSKLCLDWNNFHTSMVLTMGLLSHPVQKMEEMWQSLSNRDKTTFNTLKKLVDVSHNMGHYRHALHEVLHPDLSTKRREPFIHSTTPTIKDIASGKASPLSSFKEQHHHNGSPILSLTSSNSPTSSFPTLLFFPVVLKDLAFLMDGNSNTYGQQQCNNVNNSGNTYDDDDDTLINFAKFSSLAQYVTKVVQSTMGNYWFAMELGHFPFLPALPRSSTDSLFGTYYTSTSTSAPAAHPSTLPYSPTRSSISTVSSSITNHFEHYPHHSGHSYSLSSASSASASASTSCTTKPYYHQQSFPGASSIKPQNHHQPLSLASSPVTSSLDWVAETIEQRLIGVAACYGDPHCESRLDQILKTTL